MTWLKHGEGWASEPYQIVSGTRGWSLWIYSRKEAGCLGREIPTLDAAKFICEAHSSRRIPWEQL